jgi:hypothetical protein
MLKPEDSMFRIFTAMTFFSTIAAASVCVHELANMKGVVPWVPASVSYLRGGSDPIIVERKDGATRVITQNGAASFKGNQCQPNTETTVTKEVSRWIKGHDGLPASLKHDIEREQKEFNKLQNEINAIRRDPKQKAKIEQLQQEQWAISEDLKSHRIEAKVAAKEYMAWLKKCVKDSNEDIRRAAQEKLQLFEGPGGVASQREGKT